MTDLERAREQAKELLLSWMQTRPGGVYQSSIQATEFERLFRLIAAQFVAIEQGSRREGAAEMRERAAQIAEYYEAPIWDIPIISDSIRALPLTPEER